MSADSRQTYPNSNGLTRIGSDSAVKLFKLSSRCAVAISGRAFIAEKGNPAKDVGHFIRRFVESKTLDGMPVALVTDELSAYIGDIFIAQDREAIRAAISEQVIKDGGSDLTFADSQTHELPYTFKNSSGVVTSQSFWLNSITLLVAGIDSDSVGRAYGVTVPGNNSTGVTSDTETCGCLWFGQTDVVIRIVKGWAPEINNLPFASTITGSPTLREQLNKLEYVMSWNTMTLQDAVDFCVLMTRTTESIQRFSDGTFGHPGGTPGVGGMIDIGVITPEQGFRWLKRKALRAEGAEISIDDTPVRPVNRTV